MLEQLITSTNTNNKKIDTEIKNNLQDDSKDVFAMLLSSHIIAKENVDIKDTTNTKDTKDTKSVSKINSQTLVDEKSKNLTNLQMTNNLKSNENSTKSLSEELLSTINTKIDNLKNLQTKNDVVSQTTKANITLQSMFNELKTQKEFKEIRSVDDLVKLANKNGLNLQNLTIEKMEEAIKGMQDKKVSINDLLQSTQTQTKMTQDAIDKNKLSSSKERIDTLKKVIDKNTELENTKLNQVKDNLPQIGEFTNNSKNTLNNKDYKSEVLKDFSSKLNEIDKTQIDNKIEAKDNKKILKEIIKENSEKIDNEKNVNFHTQISDKLPKDTASTESGILNAKEKTKDLNNNLDKTKKAKKDEILKDEKKEQVNKEFSLSSILSKNLNETETQKEFSLNSLLNNIVSSKKETNSTVEQSTQKLDETFKSLSKEFNLENIDRQDIKLDTTKTTSEEFMAKTAKAKETVKKFVSDLEQKLQDYKPPLMKIELELKPQNLGSVDVTIVSRGSNLSIQLSSNSQALQMFMQNQDDFRNALNDLGFKDVKMDFNMSDGSNAGDGNASDQQSGSNQNQGSKNGYSYYTQNEELIHENKIESIEVTIPKYI